MRVALIAIFSFSQLQNVVPVTLSMKGFLSKTFKKSMRVETLKVVTKISSIATSTAIGAVPTFFLVDGGYMPCSCTICP